MRQLSLFQDVVQDQAQLTYSEFSHNGVCSEIARAAIEGQYHHLLRETDEFSRRTVSFQANKTNILHSWMKYREGFSADLVETLIRKSRIKPGDTILEPFAGSCTTLLVAMCSEPQKLDRFSGTLTVKPGRSRFCFGTTALRTRPV